jgi:hypothetical protein
MKVLLILAMVAAAGAVSGCLVHGRRGEASSSRPESCSHSDSCGHYSHKGKWHHSRGHKHGNNCGHHLNGGIWIVLD